MRMIRTTSHVNLNILKYIILSYKFKLNKSIYYKNYLNNINNFCKLKKIFRYTPPKLFKLYSILLSFKSTIHTELNVFHV